MPSFFTVPGSVKKRKRSTVPQAPKKRVAAAKPPAKSKPGSKTPTTKKRVARPESASGSNDESDDDDDDDDDESFSSASQGSEAANADDSEDEGETAAEKRLRLAERYLENVKEHVQDFGFDAAEIDRDLIAERLQEDVAETKGRVYRQLASQLDLSSASQTFFRTNTNAITSIAVCAPYFYTATKDLYLHKWRTQDLPSEQSKVSRRKPKKPPAPPKTRPEMKLWLKGHTGKTKDKNYQRHVGQILAVAASPDGKYVVTGGEDRKLIVYDAASLKPIKVLNHHRDAITGLAFRRGTNQLYSSSKDRTVKVWSLDELAYVETLFGHQDHVVDIDALAQERCVSVGARDRTARLWKVAEETQLVFRGGAIDKKRRSGVDPRVPLQEGSIDRIAMIDDELFVTGSDNGAITLWSTQKKKPVYIEPFAHGLDPPPSPTEASAEKNPGPEVVPAPIPRWITALKTIPYTDLILSGSWDGHVRLWKLTEDKKKIEAVGILGKTQIPTSGDSEKGQQQSRRAIPGVVNDIAIFERGDRGTDGLCVIAAISTEHRLGRWKVCKGVRNGGVVFEIPRSKKALLNGAAESIDGDEDGDEDEDGHKTD
ncbi:hypothetical protein CDD81_1619 [Ophiocordyceps australis]|uniref:Uncharacterized protein n=1 Tax=Ophiocordyceps australis TaxID=1399860 RepID=A0A2C5XFA3_9HYPO|nr:hypothetical protein CDD81_1619 [Ophiocordyceps australis]